MRIMQTIKKTLFVGIPMGVALMMTTPAQAYIYQPRHSPMSYAPYPRYNYDLVTPIIQGHVNFVDNFRYVPAPVRPYFYFPSYYSPFNFWGW